MTAVTLKSSAQVKRKSRIDADSPWKLALDLYFADFMKCCLPDIAKEIDWSKGYEMLDKEMQAIAYDAVIGRRITDKLIKLWKKDQQEIFFLCHLEVQNFDKTLAERMLVYRYRIRDRYHLPIISIVILIDDKPDWRPHSFRETCHGSHLEIQFLVVKLLDYRERREELAAMNNRFATLLLAQLAVLETKNDPQARLKAKTALTRALYQKGWEKKDILQLFRLVDWLIALPEELELNYNNAVTQIEEKTMRNTSFVPTPQRVGRREGGATILIRLLKHRFQLVPAKYQTQIKRANQNTLLKLTDRVLDAASLEDLFGN